ncbi:MAG: sigma-54-dependent Fis family transcriptional regulator, partial [Planctomycetota bacterium]
TLKHIYGNKSLLKYFNITLDEFIGTTSYDYLPEEAAKKIEEYDREVIQKGVPIETNEISFTQKGKLFYFKEIKFPIALNPDDVGVGGIVMDITTLKLAEQDLSDRIKFEELMSKLSATFINIKAADIDKNIERGLQIIAEFLDVQRANLFQFSHNQEILTLTHSVARDGVKTSPRILFNHKHPWFTKKLIGKESFCFSKPAELPKEAKAEKEYLLQQKIKSAFIIPLVAAGVTHGCITLSAIKRERQWPDSLKHQLMLLSEVFSNVLLRKQADEKISEHLLEIKQLKDRLEQENIYLRQEIGIENVSDEIIGQSDALRYVLYRVEQVASTNSTVLLLGETGTGKELIARAIHQKSNRTDRPLITVNCTALPGNLIESELFGRAKGAFTGAHEKQIGRFELAHKGTIFLDEIGELPLELQTKLLRVLQDGTFQSLGNPQTIKVDVRVIASTNRDLRDAMRKGDFREDLYYRLDVFPITIPPLRMRKDDIPLLIHTFVNKFSRKMAKTIDKVPNASLKALQDYDWPGNVRELQHVIERAVITSPGTSLCLTDALETPSVENSAPDNTRRLKEREREHIIKILQETNWRIEGEKGAARILDINPNTLRYRMNKLGIHRHS